MNQPSIYRKNTQLSSATTGRLNKQQNSIANIQPKKTMSTISKSNNQSKHFDDKNWIGDINQDSNSSDNMQNRNQNGNGSGNGNGNQYRDNEVQNSTANYSSSEQKNNLNKNQSRQYQANEPHESRSINPMSVLMGKMTSNQTDTQNGLSAQKKNSQVTSYSESPLGKLAASLYRSEEESFSRVSQQQPGSSSYSRLQQQQKSPTQLMSQLFRSIGMNQMSTSKAYYSKQAEEKVAELLSNPNKLNAYVKKIHNQSHDVEPEVSKHYEILLILLEQLSAAKVEVQQDQNGVSIKFNQDELKQKERQIEMLEKELESKKDESQKIVEEYEAVIRNFNDVMEKLVAEKKY